MSRAGAQYKKKDGSLAVADDRKFLFWTPAHPPNASPSLTIPIADIINLQQTPANNPKIALRVIAQSQGAKEQDTYVFSFTSSTARKEQEAITEVLRNAISALKASNAPRVATAAPSSDDGASAQLAARALANATTGRALNMDGNYDDERLRADLDLQESLLNSNQALRQRFNESFKEKPDTISIGAFSAQFWSSRLHMLRAHAIEKAQKQGDYNVLPDFTYKRIPVEGQPDKLVINLAKEQIQLLFKQYPVVREAFNDSVPQIDANQFWSRFFNSRLIKKLRGEKITEADSTDPIFDKYIDRRENGPAAISHIPHFIDLEGNEQNHSQRKGNRPDETMRPGEEERVPILRVLNSLSEKMLANVTPSDVGELHGPIGMMEDAYEQLRLRDLQASDEDNRVKLNIKDQQRFRGGDPDSQISADARLYASQDPKQVLKDLLEALTPDRSGHEINLDRAIGVQSDEDDSDDEMGEAINGNNHTSKSSRLGSTVALDTATADIMTSVRSRRQASSGDDLGTLGLSQNTFDTLVMTHNTTVEFLHYFWTLFLSGDPAQVNDLAKLVETLDKSVDRINAVAKTAEDERKKRVATMSAAVDGLKPTSMKRRRIELEIQGLGGGRKAVEQMIAPTMKALGEATRQYKKAFNEQTAALAA